MSWNPLKDFVRKPRESFLLNQWHHPRQGADCNIPSFESACLVAEVCGDEIKKRKYCLYEVNFRKEEQINTSKNMMH